MSNRNLSLSRIKLIVKTMKDQYNIDKRVVIFVIMDGEYFDNVFNLLYSISFVHMPGLNSYYLQLIIKYESVLFNIRVKGILNLKTRIKRE